ncbi:hypothetical protein FHG87_016384 [Trinorchestia longiramus]|nr:hypothetical protein FHG87_016384 [Trinorchestia longiramus]
MLSKVKLICRNGYIVPRKQPVDLSKVLAENTKKTKMVAWMVSNCNAPSMRRHSLMKLYPTPKNSARSG